MMPCTLYVMRIDRRIRPNDAINGVALK